MSPCKMWISRLGRVTLGVLIALQTAGCARQPASAPPTKELAVPGAPLSLATSTDDHAPQPSSDPLPVAVDDAVWGSPTAPVTVLEFSDLQCPFCSRVHPTVKELEVKYGPNQLRIVFKHNPLPFHPYAQPAAKVADAVLRQGGQQAFWSFLDLAFGEQMKLGDAALSDWVARVGQDPALVMKRAELPETEAKIARDIELASRVGANGTPAFRINGATLSGAQPIENFSAIIDAELIAAAGLRRKGTPANLVYGTRVAANYVAPKPEPDVDADDDADLTIWRMPINGAPALGPKDALVTMVEFYDYQCPFCRQVEATVDELLKRYPQDLRVVLRENPLPFHARALPAANLALEARAEKGDLGFLEANRDLFDEKHDKLADGDLLAIAKSLKLDEKRVRAAIAKNTHASEIDADSELAQDFKASGTPHFFINGLRLSGAQPIENFVTAIDAQLKVASALVSAGTPRARVYDEIMKHAQEPEGPEQKSMPAPTADNPTRGPANAQIVIHEFADFQCPFCGRVEKTLLEIDKAYPNEVRWVWHDYPLPFHARALPAAIVAREVRAEKGDAGFWKIHDLMFADQGVDGALSPEKFSEYSAMLKLDPARLAAAQGDKRHDAVLASDKALADAAGINGTPAFVINGYYLSGAEPLSSFKRVIRYALAHAPAKAPALAASAKP